MTAAKTKDFVVRGRIWTGCRERPWAEAAAVSGGRFVCVGSLCDARAACPTGEVEDWGDNLVMPGMTDSHMHLTAFARQDLYVNMLRINSLDEAATMLRAHAREVGPGAWIRAINYNEMAWPDGKRTPPTKEWLDALGLENPVIMSRYCGHNHVANTRAMKEGGLWDSADPCVLRGEDGVVTGLIIEGGAAPLIEAAARECETPEKLTAAMGKAVREMTSYGVTAAHACDAATYGLGEEIFTWQDLYEKGKLPIRIVCFHDRLPNFTYRSGLGNEQIRYGGLKLFLDGNLGGNTAAMREPFDDKPDTCGVLNHTDEELLSLLREARKCDIQVQMHMIGDRAIEQALDAVEKVVAEFGYERLSSKKPAWRFNHVIVCPKDLRERLARLKDLIALDVQPCQAYTDRVMAPLRLGSRRVRDAYPLRSLWDAGLLIAGGTDAPMEIENMWLGIWAAVCRTDDDGAPLAYDPTEKLILEEALTAWTVNPWIEVGLGNEFGRIEEGFHADFTVVDGDPFKRSTMDLRNTRHLVTYLEGRTVWTKQ